MSVDIKPENRSKFEKQGIGLTRQSLQMGILDAKENIDAQRWLAEQEHRKGRRENLRFLLMLGATVVAALFAGIAAWPVIKDWLK
jgi:hypothetical protein